VGAGSDEVDSEMHEPVVRVMATQEALDAIAQVTAERGPVMFFQSGGCCDGSLPMCFGDGEFTVGSHDIRLGTVGGSPFYIDHRQFEAWKHTQLILDVGAGEPEGFSLAAGRDRHFIIRSRVFSPAEQVALEGAA
jgi:uncharacterized protein (DUF779 family)